MQPSANYYVTLWMAVTCRTEVNHNVRYVCMHVDMGTHCPLLPSFNYQISLDFQLKVTNKPLFGVFTILYRHFIFTCQLAFVCLDQNNLWTIPYFLHLEAPSYPSKGKKKEKWKADCDFENFPFSTVEIFCEILRDNLVTTLRIK